MSERLQQHIYLASLELPIEWRDNPAVQAMGVKLAKSIANDCFLIAAAGMSQDQSTTVLEQINANFGFENNFRDGE